MVNGAAEWLDHARRLASGEAQPDDSIALAVESATSPRLGAMDSSVRRTRLWAVFSNPGRIEGLRWLHKTGLMGELVGGWMEPHGSDERACALALKAVEALHLERWAKVVDPEALKRGCSRLDLPLSSELGGWAGTAVALMLSAFDAPERDFARMARRALHSLDSPDIEAGAIMDILLGSSSIHAGGPPGAARFAPHSCIAALCRLEAAAGQDDRALQQLGQRVSGWL